VNPAPPDIESLLVEWLSARMQPGVQVVTDLTGLFETDTPLVVQVNALPTAADRPAWNGPTLLYRPDVDLDFYAPKRVQALDLALETMGLITDIRGATTPYGRVTDVIARTPARRPDFNQRVRRYGVICTFTARPA
jgi:hypothetical protein